MNAEVLDEYLVRINKDLAGKGLTYSELKVDILDHICCMVEEEMESGKDFEASYRKVMSGIDDAVFPDLQHKTLLLLDKKFQKMKKVTYAFGLTGSFLTITGALFKTQHWPGASIMMLVGFLAIVFGFLPLYFIGSYKEQTEKPRVIYPIVAYLSLLLVFSATVFKIMHWPGAGWLIRFSIVTILVGFLPLYIVQVFKRSVKSKINPAYIIMLLVGISIVLVLSRINLSYDAITSYTDLIRKYESSSVMLKNRINEINGEAIPNGEKEKIIMYADALELQVDQMLSGLTAAVDQEGVSIDKLEGRDSRKAAYKAYLNNGLADEFIKNCHEYSVYLASIIDDPLMKNQVEIEMLSASGEWMSGWDPSDYRDEPLIVNYYKITEIRYAILNAAYMVLQGID